MAVKPSVTAVSPIVHWLTDISAKWNRWNRNPSFLSDKEWNWSESAVSLTSHLYWVAYAEVKLWNWLFALLWVKQKFCHWFFRSAAQLRQAPSQISWKIS